MELLMPESAVMMPFVAAVMAVDDNLPRKPPLVSASLAAVGARLWCPMLTSWRHC